MEVQIEEIKNAYRKLKSHVYYDSSDLFIRKQVAIFETNLVEEKSNYHLFNFLSPYSPRIGKLAIRIPVDNKLEYLSEEINRFNSKDNTDFFDQFFNRIEMQVLPKKIKKNLQTEKCNNFLTNKRTSNLYEVTRAFIQIDVPTELQIVVVLWTLRYGFKLDKQLSKNSFGNRLILNKSKKNVTEGASLFYPYPKQYQNWRDKGISEAKRKLDDNEDVIFINLDLRDYYYSVRLNFTEIEAEFPECVNDNVHIIFKKLHYWFTNFLISKNYPNTSIVDIKDKDFTVLPIGLLSSSILANWYLKEFDEKVSEEVRPVYYGRYVDDILIVLSNQANPLDVKTQPHQADTDCKSMIEKYLENILRPVAELIPRPDYLSKEIESENVFCIRGKKDCIFQSEKTLIYFFDHNESFAAIDKLKKDIEKRTSEFQDVPGSYSDNLAFDDQAFHLVFDSTEGKFRTLKDYKENRYGLSTFLSHRIFEVLRRDKASDTFDGKKILQLFKGTNCLEYFRLWEKIFVFFLVNRDKSNFVDFFINTFITIENTIIQLSEEVRVEQKELSNSLKDYLFLCFEIAYSLNPIFISEHDEEYKKFSYFVNEKNAGINYFDHQKLPELKGYYIKRFRKSNLIRHHYVVQPLLNYTKVGKGQNIDLTTRNNFTSSYKSGYFDFNEELALYNPRNVKFWECCLSYARYSLFESSFKTRVETGCSEIRIDCFDAEKFLTAVKDKYDLFNQNRHNSTYNSDDIYSIQSQDIELETQIKLAELHINSKNVISDTISIGIVNTKLFQSNYENSLRGNPNFNNARFSDLSKILNQTKDEKADMLVFPECFLPFDSLETIVSWAEKHQIAVVTGLEPWNINGIVYNLIVTILPLEINGIKDAVVTFRLKNFYSHHECQEITGNGFIVPKPEVFRYELFNWRGLYFAPYYCFELANSIHRSVFRSKVDLIIASEWNQDTNYFSNIVESLSRDLHVYVAQVNNSVFGDSRLTQPSPSDVKDIVRLKGGRNSTVLVGHIDIHSLREFQRKDFTITKGNKEFKPLPPEFNRKDVLKRINNRFLLQSPDENLNEE